jgi:hypothetical protein
MVDRSVNIVLPSVGFGWCCSQPLYDSLMVLWRRGRLSRTNSAELECTTTIYNVDATQNRILLLRRTAIEFPVNGEHIRLPVGAAKTFQLHFGDGLRRA